MKWSGGVLNVQGENPKNLLPPGAGNLMGLSYPAEHTSINCLIILINYRIHIMIT